MTSVLSSVSVERTVASVPFSVALPGVSPSSVSTSVGLTLSCLLLSFPLEAEEELVFSASEGIDLSPAVFPVLTAPTISFSPKTAGAASLDPL